jgi:cytochrome b561
MSVAYLIAAVFSGLTMALIWLYADGAWWSAILVYIMSGNLVLAGLVLRVLWRKPDSEPDATPERGEQTQHATEA